MQAIKLLCCVAVFLMLAGCANTGVREDKYPAMTALKPRSILVVPVVNNSVDVNASTSVLSTLPKVLAERGYYVFPVNTVKTLLEYEGLYEPAEIHREQVTELAELFGADAVLYVTVHKWAAEYILVNTRTTVELEYTLVARTGEDLWSARKRVSYSPNEGNDYLGKSGLEGLLVSAVAAAFERADPNYMPLTRKANTEVFETGATVIPPGPYAPDYDTYYQKFEQPESTAP
ncbi:MAG TPA: GNA1162 family protein [Marinagarivorans sp.]